MKVESDDGACWCKPEPRSSQERVEELGVAGGKAPSTSGVEDVVKNLTDLEDKPKNTELKGFQRFTGNKVVYHSLDDSRTKWQPGESGKFFRRTVELTDGAFWWKPDPQPLAQECIEDHGLAGARDAWHERHGEKPR